MTEINKKNKIEINKKSKISKVANPKLAETLRTLKNRQGAKNVVRHSDYEPRDIAILSKSGFLEPIVSGWSVITHPHQQRGDSVTMAASYWEFLGEYLNARFGHQWVLSPADSAPFVTEATAIPKSVVVFADKGNNSQFFPFSKNISVFVQRKDTSPSAKHIRSNSGIRHYSSEYCLSVLSQAALDADPTTAGILIRKADPDTLAGILLENGNSDAIRRVAGLYRVIGNEKAERRLARQSGISVAGYYAKTGSRPPPRFHPAPKAPSPYASDHCGTTCAAP